MTTLDLIQIADALPPPGEKGFATATHFDIGGPAANAAVTAKKLGSEAVLVTSIGVGPLPDYARTLLAGFGVELREQPAGRALPVASIWVDTASGERTIFAEGSAGANAAPGPDALLPPETVAVLIDGHHPALAVAAASEASDRSIPIVLDCGRWRPVYDELLPVATDVIMCETFRPPGITGADSAALAAIAGRWRPEVCAMTRGGDDILIAGNQGVSSLPVPQVDVVDTTGAGDVFHGAYTYFRYGAPRDAHSALEAAAIVASASCTHLGVRRTDG